jgi:uncharacterized membrane protein YccC
MLVVIGGLQHQGNIRQKAFERAIGTALGAVLGLTYVAQYSAFGSTALTYALLSVTAGVCGYYAIGKGGYIALLTAITMCIVAGHGDDSIEIGLWRTANVLIGIAIALAFSFALPLHASYSWRYGLALNLRKSAKLLGELLSESPMTTDEQLAAFTGLNARLVAQRGLMPSVARESDIPIEALETVQRRHRGLVSAVEMLASASLTLREISTTPEVRTPFIKQGTAIRRSLLQTSRALRSGDPRARERLLQRPSQLLDGFPPSLPVLLDGPYWLLEQIAAQTERIRQGLLLCRPELWK